MEIALTEKETELLTAIAKGMDQPGSGWLHELVSNVTHSTAGVLGSLMKKGLVSSFVDEGNGFSEDATWVELTGEGWVLTHPPGSTPWHNLKE